MEVARYSVACRIFTSGTAVAHSAADPLNLIRAIPAQGMQRISPAPAKTKEVMGMFSNTEGGSAFSSGEAGAGRGQAAPENPDGKARAEKRLTGWDLAFLWFGAAVVIDEIWSGAQVTPLGLALGAVVIIAGKFVGNLLLALVAKMGAAARLPTMILSRASFGIRGSVVPAVCNILQLIGWTAYMLIVAAKAVGILFGTELGTAASHAIIIVLGLLTTAWAAGGHRYWKAANGIAAALLVILSLVMTYGVFSRHTLADLAAVTPPAGLSPMLTFDFVIAMAVSWVPLAADYSRFAVSPRAAAAGTYWGYFFGSSWMYLIGLAAGMAYLSQNPGAAAETLEPNVVVLGALQGMKLVSAGGGFILLLPISTTVLFVFRHPPRALTT